MMSQSVPPVTAALWEVFSNRNCTLLLRRMASALASCSPFRIQDRFSRCADLRVPDEARVAWVCEREQQSKECNRHHEFYKGEAPHRASQNGLHGLRRIQADRGLLKFQAQLLQVVCWLFCSLIV
jgi:hypothetical protein